MQACEGVFAAGDIATFPLKMLNWENVNIGHWQMAAKHGKRTSSSCFALFESVEDSTCTWGRGDLNFILDR